MSETTLEGNTLNRDAWLLGHEITPNIEKALSAEAVSHFRRNKGEIVSALQRGFLLPSAVPLPAITGETSSYAIEDTDCFEWLGHMEQFSKDYFGMTVSLREMFPFPSRLPWKQILPIFDPQGFTNRDMVDKALKKQGLSVWEGTRVDAFTGSTADASRLYLIERTPRPCAGTMGLPPKYAKNWFFGRMTRPLHLRGYGIGTGLLYKIEKAFLDPEAKTVSWFVENTYGPGGGVAFGYCDPGDRAVNFNRFGAPCEYTDYGFRQAIALSLTPQS